VHVTLTVGEAGAITNVSTVWRSNLSSVVPFFQDCLKAVGVHYLRIENAEGYVLIAVYLFIYLFICMRVIHLSKKVLNRIA